MPEEGTLSRHPHSGEPFFLASGSHAERRKVLGVNLREQDTGPAERALAVVLNSGAHLWHNRPGWDVGGTWRPATPRVRAQAGTAVAPGLFVPAAVRLCSRSTGSTPT